MKIKFICIGKNTDNYINEGVNEYFHRIKKYVPIEIIYLRGIQKSKNTKTLYTKEKEGEMILKSLDDHDFLILLDEKGETYTSVKFAETLENMMVNGLKDMAFVIGGAFGFSDSVYKRSNKMVSLSKMTFPHQLIRIIFMEQLYRAFTIIKKEPYHNE